MSDALRPIKGVSDSTSDTYRPKQTLVEECEDILINNRKEEFCKFQRLTIQEAGVLRQKYRETWFAYAVN